MEHTRGDKFDAPFARIDHIGPRRYLLGCGPRANGGVHVGVTLAETLRILETDAVPHPI
jgi:hypothetical protein